MDFTLKQLDKSTTADIAKKNYSIDKSGISKWLIEKNLMTQREELQNFSDIQPWTRTGGETYSTIFEFKTDKQTQKIFVKAIVTTNPEKSLIDWTKRRDILSNDNIPVSRWLWSGEATIFESFYPKTVEETTDENELIKIAFKLDKLGFTTLKFLDDIRCDENGNPFFIDFGFDLGEPSENKKTSAKEFLIKKYPALKVNVEAFYTSNSF